MNGNLNTLVLSFGGNQPKTFDCFKKALIQLSKDLGSLQVTSKIYESEAWGFDKPTNPFLNQIVVFSSKHNPIKALTITQEIEKRLGRKSKSIERQYTDRPIDIDILYYNSEVINQDKLTIPHYLISERKFILTPLNEILPNFIHPILNKSSKELLLQCEDNLTVNPIKKQD